MDRYIIRLPQSAFDFSFRALTTALNAAVFRATRSCGHEVFREGLSAGPALSGEGARNAVSSICADMLNAVLTAPVIETIHAHAGASILGYRGARVEIDVAIPWLTAVRLLSAVTKSPAADFPDPRASGALGLFELSRSLALLGPPARCFGTATSLCCAMCVLARVETGAWAAPYLMSALNLIESAIAEAERDAGSHASQSRLASDLPPLRRLVRRQMAHTRLTCESPRVRFSRKAGAESVRPSGELSDDSLTEL